MVLFCLSAKAQIQVTGANTPIYTPESLIENIFLGDGVEVTSIVYTGTDDAVGAFTNGLADIGLDRGIVMSTGASETAATPNNAGGTTGATSGSINDVHLAATTTVGIMDLCRYEISFVPTSDTLRFNYVFASEEYPEYACSAFNDVFGFFIDGPVPGGMPGEMYNWQNIALIPDPSDFSGETFLNFPVTINFVNDGVGANGNIGNCTLPDGSTAYSQYYNSVGAGDTPTYDGYLNSFIAQAIVTPCEEYTIKLAIADGQDNQFDSAVFLEAKSFGTGSLDVSVETVSIDGSIAEGCNPGILTVSLPNTVGSDLDVDFNIIDDPNLPDIATNGVDYEMLDGTITIPAGESSVSFVLQAYEDFMDEGDEFIYFDIQRDVCNRDTIRVIIRESIIEAPEMPNDTTICPDNIVFFDANLPETFMLPEPPRFEYQGGEQLLGDLNEETISYNFDIDVIGVAPEFLGPGVIKSVCIDSMTSLGIDFTIYDIYLIAPDGQILELMTDIGQGLSDGTVTDVDTLINVCFTPESTLNINNGGPLIGPYFPGNPTYTGNFEPEGVFSDLWDGGSNNTNGTWSLLVFLDEKPIPLAIIEQKNLFKSWSICFNSVYQVDYEWTPDNGTIDCPTCEDINVNPDQDTWYYLTLNDSYGCTVVDSVFVQVNSGFGLPTNLVCNVISTSSILFDWDDAPVGGEFEVQINGMGPWINIGTQSDYLIDLLGFDETVSLSVRIVSPGCIGPVATEMCTTPSCVGPNVVVDNFTSPSCTGYGNGNILLNASGSIGPYEYILDDDTLTSGFFENLEAGTYNFIISDGNDCDVPFNFTLDEADPIVSSVQTTVPLNCVGDVDAEATVTASGGTTFFTYEWSNGDMMATATDLGEGWHYVTITDSNLCPKEDSIFISAPNPLEVDTIIITNVLCFGDATGSAYVNASGGTGMYSYNWNDPLATQTDTVKNLGPGVIGVTVTDENMCSDVASALVEQPDEIIGDITPTDISCFDADDGMALVNVSGGVGQFQFMWSDNQTTNPAVDIDPGPISVTVTDENLCSIILNTTFAAPPTISIMETIDSVSCFSGADGAIQIVATGGTGMLSYLWDSGEMTSSISNKTAGQYCVVVSDESNCSATACYDIEEPEALLITTDATSVGCNGALDGSITLTVQGGVPSYTYEWQGDMFTSDQQNPDNLSAGMYTVTVTDHYNCTATGFAEVTEDDPIIVMNTNTDVRCFGDFTGEINLDVSGGNGTLSYSWIGPNNFTSNSQDITDLEFGQYMLTISDENNCEFINSYLINQPATVLAASMSPTDTLCFGVNDGSLTVTPEGGTLPYSYEWSNNEVTPTINNLSSGVYTVTVTDLLLCEYIISGEVVQLEEIDFTLDLTSPSCFNDSDGSAEIVSVSYGNTPADLNDFTASWSNQSGNNTLMVNGLVGGNTYFVTITDGFGCEGVKDYMVSEPDPVELVLVDQQDVSCYQGEDGMVEVDAVGGTGPYTYKWSQEASFQEGAIASDLKAGSFQVTVTDSNGCSGVGFYTLVEPIAINIDFRVFDVFCNGGSDGEVEIIVGGGSAPYSVNWSTGSDSTEITGLVSGEYYLTLTDAMNCEILDTVVVGEPENVLDLDAQAYDVNCFGGRDGSIEITGFGGTGIYAYSIDGLSYTGSPTKIGLEAGSYTVYIKDSNGCIDSLDNIIVGQENEINVNLGPDVTVSYGDNYKFEPVVVNATGNIDYSWESFNQYQMDCQDCPISRLLEVIEPMIVELTVTDENGCTSKDVVNVYVEKFNFIRVPTGFTPNGDGINDILLVFGQEETFINSFRIYSRWGEKVFELNDFLVNDELIGWDGNFKGKPMNSDVFIWVVEALYIDGTTEVIHGNTTLIR